MSRETSGPNPGAGGVPEPDWASILEREVRALAREILSRGMGEAARVRVRALIRGIPRALVRVEWAGETAEGLAALAVHRGDLLAAHAIQALMAGILCEAAGADASLFAGFHALTARILGNHSLWLCVGTAAPADPALLAFSRTLAGTAPPGLPRLVHPGERIPGVDGFTPYVAAVLPRGWFPEPDGPPAILSSARAAVFARVSDGLSGYLAGAYEFERSISAPPHSKAR